LLAYVCELDDVEPMASTLLHTFGDLETLLHVSGKRLQPYTTNNEAIGPLLRLVGHLATLVVSATVNNRPLINNAASLMGYFRYKSKPTHSETIRILFLDGSWRLISDEVISQGGRVAALTSMRDIARQAATLSAQALIFAHLRPTHDDPADEDDVELYGRMRDLCRVIDISHGEHLLIGRTGFVSLMESPT